MNPDIKQCPVCGEGVIKEQGCNFITCNWSKCGGNTYFCFLCGDKLTSKDHILHFRRSGPFGDICNNLED